MATAMGGRLAEEIKFGVDKVTSGAINDFKQATRIATEMVARLGTSFFFHPTLYTTTTATKTLTMRLS